MAPAALTGNTGAATRPPCPTPTVGTQSNTKQYKPTQTITDQYKPVQASINQYKPVLTTDTSYRLVHTNRHQNKSIWTNANQYRPVQTSADQQRPIDLAPHPLPPPLLPHLPSHAPLSWPRPQQWLRPLNPSQIAPAVAPPPPWPRPPPLPHLVGLHPPRRLLHVMEFHEGEAAALTWNGPGRGAVLGSTHGCCWDPPGWGGHPGNPRGGDGRP